MSALSLHTSESLFAPQMEVQNSQRTVSKLANLAAWNSLFSLFPLLFFSAELPASGHVCAVPYIATPVAKPVLDKLSLRLRFSQDKKPSRP